MQSGILTVYEAGKLTVVGFGGQDILDNVNLGACRDELVALIQEHKTEVLAFDLTGVKLVPSGMLGLIASIKQLEISVHVYNPSEDIRDVLEVTHLDKIVEIHEVEV